MKKLLLIAAALFASVAAYAQAALSNGNFETWTGTGNQRRPQGWIVTDDVLTAAGLPLSTNNVSRSNTSHGGTYAAQLATAAVFGRPFTAFMALGNAATIDASDAIPGGVRYTGRPGRMDFYYKLTGTGVPNDSASAGVILTRWANGTREYIAAGNLLLLTAAPNYTLGSVPLQYASSATPDTLRIYFATGGEKGTLGTTLTIDDVALLGTPAATRDARADAALGLYPTRSADRRFTLSAPTRPELLTGPLSVTDAAGRVVLRQGAVPAAGTRPVELLAGTPAGVYVLRLDTPAGPLTRRLLVE